MQRQFEWNIKAYFLGKTRLIVLDLTALQPLWVILCCLQEKGRKEIEEIVVEMKEKDRDKSEETEEIKTFPLFPYLLEG